MVNTILKDDVFKFIHRISIELSNKCNYSNIHHKCPLNLETEHVILPMKIVYKIIDCLGEHKFAGKIAFHTYNEPLIDPRLFTFIQYAKSKCPSSHIMIMTNGYYLNQILAEELENIGVSSLYVTAYSKEENERFKQIKINIPFIIQSGAFDNRLNIYDRTPSTVINTMPCYAPLNEVIITRDAKIGLCCYDWKRKHCFGSMYERELDEILLDDNILSIYESLSSGNRVYDICKVCGCSR